MNNDLTLVILAAGMGSRFGGLKQIEGIGPNDEFIIDYSVYDAVEAGFNKVVFIIKEENYEIFKETIGKRVEPYVKVEYAFQKNDNLEKYNIPKDRVKPFGTAHALLCAKEYVNEKFAIISSDDFYGKDSFKQCAEYLRNNNDFCVIGYKVGETLSDKGAVKRGICMEKNGFLTDVIESKVERSGNIVKCEPLNGGPILIVNDDHPVSMIMFGLTPHVFKIIENQIDEFFTNHQDDLSSCEFLMPDVLDKAIKTGDAKIKVVPTNAKWHGITYREDLDNMKSAINMLIEKGDYKKNLWKQDKLKVNVYERK